jgi:transposase
MSETRRRFDREFREGADRLVHETGRPIAQIARDLGINAGTLGNCVALDREAQGGGGLSVDDAAELKRLRSEVAEREHGRGLDASPRPVRAQTQAQQGIDPLGP